MKLLSKISSLFNKKDDKRSVITLLTKPSYIGRLVKIKKLHSMNLEEKALFDFCFNNLSRDKYTKMAEVLRSTMPMLCVEEIEDWQMQICQVAVIYNNKIMKCFKCHCEVIQ